MATYVEQALAKLKQFEGSVPWMYLDTVGKVTVGVGMMLADASAAAALPFLVGGQPVAKAQLEAEFHRVSAMERGLRPEAYHLTGGPELAEGTIADHLRATLVRFEVDLRAHVAGYDDLPDAAKMVLLDMAYNLGPAGLLRGYPRMLAAVGARQWATAAAECMRHGISAERNAWARLELLSAAAVARVIRASAERSAALLRWAAAAAAGGLLAWAVLSALRRSAGRAGREPFPN